MICQDEECWGREILPAEPHRHIVDPADDVDWIVGCEAP